MCIRDEFICICTCIYANLYAKKARVAAACAPAETCMLKKRALQKERAERAYVATACAGAERCMLKKRASSVGRGSAISDVLQAAELYANLACVCALLACAPAC